jgi:hypothetical protein
MRTLLAGAIVAASLVSIAPASAQSFEIGPNGPRVDLRSRAQRDRDYDRRMMRRDEYRRSRDADDGYYRRQRYDDDRPVNRRGYAY